MTTLEMVVATATARFAVSSVGAIWGVYKLKQLQKARQAYEIARQGGKHAGFLKNYANRSAEEIRKGIQSIEKLIAEHKDKIANPEKYIEQWNKLNPRHREDLINRKWPGDIQRQNEQLEILKELLKTKM